MDVKQLIKQVADRTISEKFTIPDVNFDFFGWEDGKGMYVKDTYIQLAEKYEHIDMRYDVFDWQNGVGFYALIQAGKRLGDKRYIEFVKEWVDGHLEKGLPPENINTTAPFLSVLELYREYGEPRYRELCARRAAYMMAEARRASEGAFEHTVMGVNMRFSSQIWADTLFMGALFLARWGAFTGECMYMKEAARQLRVHYQYLTDTDTGLLFHGYNCEERSHMSAVRWGRANGWGILSSVEILDVLPVWMAEREEIKANLAQHLAAMARYQEVDGSFHTVLDQPGTYRETTAASAFACAARRAAAQGCAPADGLRAEDALQYVAEHVAPDGTVRGASGGTPVMCSVEEYGRIPCVMSYYGQGMALLALCAFAE